MNIENSFEIENEKFYYYDLEKVFVKFESLRKLPISLKILLEENLRNIKNENEFDDIINIFLNRLHSNINIYPSRLIMQDYIGIPAFVDLASMRDKANDIGLEINNVNPQITVDLIIDDTFNKNEEFNEEIKDSFEKNIERYKFIKWAQSAFKNFRVIPPESGMYDHLHLEYLSTIVHLKQENGKNYLFPEIIVGTNAYSTMINSFGVLGFKVTGIEAQSTMLGLSQTLAFPKVIGINLKNRLAKGMISSDLVLILTSLLKQYDLKDKIVEFCGEGIKDLTLEDRTTISNLSSKYGAKSSFFPIDNKTLLYYNFTRENSDFSNLIKTYLEKQSLYFNNEILDYDEIIELDLQSLVQTISILKNRDIKIEIKDLKDTSILNRGFILKDADIVFANILSPSMVTNPYLLIHASLLAKKAFDLGIKPSSNIKKVLVVESLIVLEHLKKLDLLKYFEYMGFEIFTSKSKINNRLDKKLEEDIKENSLNVVSLNSRDVDSKTETNYLIKSNYIVSSSMIIAFCIAKNIKCDILNDVLCKVEDKEIRLADIWPSYSLVVEYLNRLDFTLYKDIYKNIFKGNNFWQKLEVENSSLYKWDECSTYIRPSNFFDERNIKRINIKNAKILALFGDSISSEDISFDGQISLYSAAAKYLEERGVKSFDYSTFRNRRGNSELMLRGVFDDTQLKNKMVSKEGGFTKDFDTGEILSIYDFSRKFINENRPLVIFAGAEYGVGESRDWAAKGTRLLGVKAIIAKSFGKVHRKELISLGILPLEFTQEEGIENLSLMGNETIDIVCDEEIKKNNIVKLKISSSTRELETELKSRLDTLDEISFYKKGGVLPFLLHKMLNKYTFKAKDTK